MTRLSHCRWKVRPRTAPLLPLLAPLLMGSSAAEWPEDSADAVVYLVPEQDSMIISREEQQICGEIVQVLKGNLRLQAPTVVIPAGTILGTVKKGQVAKLYLKKIPERDAHQIIGNAGGQSPRPTVALSMRNGPGKPAHYFQPSDEVAATAMITIPSGVSDEARSVDVYVTARLPDGRYASWVRGEYTITHLVEGSEPVPWVRNVRIADGGMLLPTFGHIFSYSDPPGTYIIHALLVRPGTDPLDMRNWISASSAVFELQAVLVAPPAPAAE